MHMLKISRSDAVTPANAVTALGIILTAAGSLHLDTAEGLSLTIAGKMLDVIDGPVARRTHTSNFGALVDSTADKLTCLILIIAAYHFRLVPITFLWFVFVYQGLVAAMSFDAIRKGWDVHPSTIGKYAMFVQVSALLMFVFSHVVTAGQQFTHVLAIVFAAFAIISSIVSFIYYIREYFREVFLRAHK